MTADLPIAWALQFLEAIPGHLPHSDTMAARIILDQAWVDSDGLVCLIYRWRGDRRLWGYRNEVTATNVFTGEPVTSVIEEVGDWIDCSIGETDPSEQSDTRYDTNGVGWWGQLGEQLPTYPPRSGTTP